MGVLWLAEEKFLAEGKNVPPRLRPGLQGHARGSSDESSFSRRRLGERGLFGVVGSDR